MDEAAPDTVPVEAAAEQENAAAFAEEAAPNADLDQPAAADAEVDNSNKRAREEGDEPEEDEEPSAKRTNAGAEENGAADHSASDPAANGAEGGASAPYHHMDNPGNPAEGGEHGTANKPPAMSDVNHPIIKGPDGKSSQIVEVAKHMVGKLIGKQGSTIRQLQDSTGCSIQVDHTTVGDFKKVTLTAASEETLVACRDAIVKALEAEAPGPAEGEISQVVKCAPGLVGRIIGRGGETIKMLQVASSAHIMVNQNFPEGVDREITCKGNQDAVDRAVKMITELMAGEPNSAQNVIQKYGLGATLTLTCPQNLVGRIIGKGGETIKGLQRKFNVGVQIDQNQNPPVVTITGPRPAATACQAEVRNIMSDTMPPFGGGGPGGPGGFGGPRPGFGGPGPRPGFAPGFSMPYGGAPAPFAAPYGFGAPTYGGYNAAPSFPGYGGYSAGMGGGAAAGGYGAGGYGAPAAAGYGAAPGGYGGAGAGMGGGYGGGAPAGVADPYMQQQGGYGGGAAASGGYGGGAAGGGAGGGYGGGAGGAPAPAAASSVWQAMQDDQGRTYYYNTQTGASQWEKPADMP